MTIAPDPITSTLSPNARPVLDGRFVLPADAGWDEARVAWNLAVDQRPAAVALPAHAEDVAATVRFAREHGLRVAPQTTGHNAAPIESLERTVLVKTSALKEIHIDPLRRRARVGAGVEWAEVTGPAAAHGLAALGGSSPDVGVVGYTLGGGIGWLGRRYGLAANHVLAIELVTADGALRRVDEDHDADLFWALRGGGGNFGVVTAIEFALFPHAEVYAGAMLWPAERASEVLHRWREWTLTAPDEVTTSARVLQVPPMPDVPEPLRGRAFVVIDGAFTGTEEEGRALLEPLRELGPEMDMFAMIPAPGLQKIHMDPESPVPGLSDHALLGELPAEAIDALVAAADPAAGSPLVVVELRQLGGALSRHPEHGAGALGALDAAYGLFALGVPTDPAAIAAIEAHLALLRGALAPYETGGKYLNFAERPTDAATMFRPEAYRRLRDVKAAYDPAGLFRANHPIAAAS